MNKKIMDLIHNRLDIGFIKYGNENLESDGRDFEKEALEEILDCCIYIAARLIEIKRPKMKKYEWWKDEEPVANDDENDVDLETKRVEKLIPKDPMAIIARASKKLRKEMDMLEEDDDDKSKGK